MLHLRNSNLDSVTKGYIINVTNHYGGNMRWLKEKRNKMNLTQTSIAKKCNITSNAYCMIEKGNRRPSVKLAKQIADILNFDWTRFYDDVEAATKESAE